MGWLEGNHIRRPQLARPDSFGRATRRPPL
jgi:hypothetical protein